MFFHFSPSLYILSLQYYFDKSICFIKLVAFMIKIIVYNLTLCYNNKNNERFFLVDNIPILKSTITVDQARNLNPLVLAFIGDSVQQLYVRTKLVVGSTKKTGELHKLAIKEIKAEAQADIVNHLLPHFNEEELNIYKRARNSKANTVAKNASIADYKRASGFEAVIGYLYLTGQHERLYKLLTYDFNEDTL